MAATPQKFYCLFPGGISSRNHRTVSQGTHHLDELFARATVVNGDRGCDLYNCLDDHRYSGSADAGCCGGFPDLNSRRGSIPGGDAGSWRGGTRRFKLELDALLQYYSCINNPGNLSSIDRHKKFFVATIHYGPQRTHE